MSVRLPELIVAVVALTGCRGDETKPTPASSSPTGTGAAQPRPALPASAARSPEERAALEHALAGPEETFRAEPLDPAWAKQMTTTIKSKATWADVECRNLQCRVVFVAPTAEAAMAKTDELRELRDPDDQPLAQWQPVPPITREDGSIEVRVYAHFTRE